MKQLIKEIEERFEQENLTKGLIIEARLDSVIRTIVKDIIYVLKKQQEGEFELPQDLRDNEETYQFTHFMNEFTIELVITFDESIDSFKIDGNYYNEEDVLEVGILVNPTKLVSQLQSMIGPLNELIAHELTHIQQHERGYDFPIIDPEDPFDYYTQEHELEAQYKGFKRRAKKEKKSMESLIDDWFEKNQDLHLMTPEKKYEFINKILKWKS